MTCIPDSVENLIGQKFGRLQVIDFGGWYVEKISGQKRPKWLCRCECGNTTTVIVYSLKSGHTQSCGCYQRDQCTKHGHADSRVYNIWTRMRDRCNNPKHKAHNLYFDRGIRVCEEWENSFKSFYDWSMENGYRDDLSIDRIDNNKGYSPDNCRWATRIQQQNNMRTNKLLVYRGETHTVAEWARKIGIKRCTLDSRLKKGFSVEEALTRPVQYHRRRKNECRTMES